MNNALNGARVLVTRPQQQADALCELIEQRGGIAVRLPTLAIVAQPVDAVMQQTLEQLADYQWLIFVSRNAVDFALQANGGKIADLPNTKLAAVGKATAKALAQAGIAVDLVPENDFNSEALLATPALQHVAEQRCLIVRGQGGRETLADSLRQRGATVDYLEVYRREIPAIDTRPVRQLLADKQLDAVTVTSAEALNNLMQMLDEPSLDQMRQLPLVVVSERIKHIAQQLGFKNIAVTALPADAAILETLTTQDMGKASGRSN